MATSSLGLIQLAWLFLTDPLGTLSNLSYGALEVVGFFAFLYALAAVVCLLGRARGRLARFFR
jgi:hypothetical protein